MAFALQVRATMSKTDPWMAVIFVLAAAPRSSEAVCAELVEQGSWVNDDTTTNTISRIELTFVRQDEMFKGEPYPPGPSWYVRISGRCLPRDCDWGLWGARTISDYVYAVVDQGFARRFIWLKTSQLRPGHMWAYVWTDFLDAQQQDYVVQGWFHRV